MTAKRLSADQIGYLVRNALGATGTAGERLRAIWQAIATARHIDDRRAIAQQILNHARRNGLFRECHHRDGNDLDHVIAWGIRGQVPFGGANE